MAKHAQQRTNPQWARLSGSVLALCGLLTAACGEDAHKTANSRPASMDAGGAERRVDGSASDANAPDASPSQAGSELRPAFCDRQGDDAVRDVFCIGAPPVIANLEEFQNLFDVNPRGPEDPNDVFQSALYLSAINGDVAVLGHSTALSGRVVSPINPRAILIGDKIILTYQRGVQRLELATRDRQTYLPIFYLLTFEQACNQREGGCTPGELFTPEVERDWRNVGISEAEDLKNTPLDCRQCHQRGLEHPVLLMRELQSPWTHFLFPVESTDGTPGITGADLMRDYLNAKGDELYGGLAVDTIASLGPFKLQTIVDVKQPLLFDSPGIQNERWSYGPDGYASEPQPSAKWNAAYEAFKRGEQLALPYVEQRAIDERKQAELGKAYQRYRAGALEARELPDLGDIFSDDPYIRARVGLSTEPDATPEDALIQACGSCHNDVLDQSISRARFTIALARLDRAELNVAIDRVSRPRDAPGAMPPPEARQLEAGVRERLLEYLRGDLDPTSIDPRLERAATLGMSGGGG